MNLCKWDTADPCTKTYFITVLKLCEALCCTKKHKLQGYYCETHILNMKLKHSQEN